MRALVVLTGPPGYVNRAAIHLVARGVSRVRITPEETRLMASDNHHAASSDVSGYSWDLFDYRLGKALQGHKGHVVVESTAPTNYMRGRLLGTPVMAEEPVRKCLVCLRPAETNLRDLPLWEEPSGLDAEVLAYTINGEPQYEEALSDLRRKLSI